MIKNLLLAVLIISSLHAKGNLSFNETDKQIVYYTYNFEFEKAESLLEKELNKDPGNLKYYFLSLGIKSMIIEKSVFEEFPEKKWDLKKRLNEETIVYANEVLSKFENVKLTTENKFYLGCIYGYLGRMYGVTSSWMSAFSEGKTGRGLLEEVIEENPAFYDAYLLLGMFNYYADRMGGFLGFVAGILGFSGDRDKGLEYILTTYQKGFLLSDQAELLLIELYSGLEGNKFAALPLHRNYVKKYPNNHQMLNWYLRDLLHLDMITEAREVVMNDTKQLLDPYLLAQYYHKSGEYKLSNEKLDDALRRKERYFDRQQVNIKFLKTVNNWLLGNKLTGDFQDEEYALLLSAYKKNPDYAKSIFHFAAAARTGKVDSGLKDLLESKPKEGNGLLDVQLAYDSGVYYFQKGLFEKARKKFEYTAFYDKKLFHYKATEYLITIYSRTEVRREKVKQLLEEIEDLEYERLSYFARDLEKKYNL